MVPLHGMAACFAFSAALKIWQVAVVAHDRCALHSPGISAQQCIHWTMSLMAKPCAQVKDAKQAAAWQHLYQQTAKRALASWQTYGRWRKTLRHAHRVRDRRRQACALFFWQAWAARHRLQTSQMSQVRCLNWLGMMLVLRICSTASVCNGYATCGAHKLRALLPSRQCTPCTMAFASLLQHLYCCAGKQHEPTVCDQVDRSVSHAGMMLICCHVQVVQWRAIQLLRLHLAAWQVTAVDKVRRRAQATTALVWYAQQV